MADSLLTAEIEIQDGFSNALQRLSYGLDNARSKLERLHSKLSQPIFPRIEPIRGISSFPQQTITQTVKPIVAPSVNSIKPISIPTVASVSDSPEPSEVTSVPKPPKAVSISASAEPLISEAGKATRALKQTEERANSLGHTASRAFSGNDVSNMTSRVGILDDVSNRLKGTILSLGAAFATAFSAGQVIQTADAMQNVRSRLALINDGKQSVPELENDVYAAAIRARTDMGTMGQVITRVGMNAGNAFKSTREIESFSEILAKQYAIAGATPEEMQQSIIQLTQGLGAGVLRGDELQSVFEGAPTVIQSIAKYLDVPIGKIRDLASEGVLTADIVKNAILASADETNKKLSSMPVTWAQAWTMFKTSAVKSFQPVLERVSSLTSNPAFQQMASTAIAGIQRLGEVSVATFDGISSGITWARENLGFMVPILGGMATGWLAVRGAALATTAATSALTAAQWMLNAAMSANPVGLVVIGMGALCGLIYGGVQLFNRLTGSSETFGDAVGSAMGIAYGSVKNLATYLDNVLGSVINGIANAWDLVGTIFENVWTRIQAKFWGFMADITGGISDFFKDKFDVDLKWNPNSEKTIGDYAKEFQAKHDSLMAEPVRQFNKTPVYTPMAMEDVSWDFGEMAKKGRTFLDQSLDSISAGFTNFFTPTLPTVGGFQLQSTIDPIDAETKAKIDRLTKAAEQTARNTRKENYDDEIKLMQEYGERLAVNRISNNTYGINVTNNATVNNDLDVESIFDRFMRRLKGEMMNSAEGVH